MKSETSEKTTISGGGGGYCLEHSKIIDCKCDIKSNSLNKTGNLSQKCMWCGRVYTYCTSCNIMVLRALNLEYCTQCGEELEFITEYHSYDYDMRRKYVTFLNRDKELAIIKKKIDENETQADHEFCRCGSPFVFIKSRYCHVCGSKRSSESVSKTKMRIENLRETPEGFEGIRPLEGLGWYSELM